MCQCRQCAFFACCICVFLVGVVTEPADFCDAVGVLPLSILSPLEGSYLLKGLVHFHFLTGATHSEKLRYFVFVDDDPVVAPNVEGQDETVVFMGNESIGIEIEDVGVHVFSLVQTCSPSAWKEEGDEVDVRRIFVSFTSLQATKTGRKMDGAAGVDEPVRKHYLSVVAVFRDEEMYLQEWIEFHRCAGVDHFYLFNHHSATDEYRKVLEPYIQAGLVDLDDATDSLVEDGEVVHHAQLLTFSRAVDTYKNESLWMAFIDVDEFLFAVGPVTLVDAEGSTKELARPSLKDVLPAYQEFGGVVVHWVMYGSSGYDSTPRGLVIENYVWRAAEVSPLFKSISKPSRVVSCNNHNHEFQADFFAVNEDNDIIPHNTSQNHPGTARVFRINHYRCKSRQHLGARLQRALQADSFHRDDDDREFNRSSSSARRLLQRWEEEAAQNEVEDKAAQQLLSCVQGGLKLRGVPDWLAFFEFAAAAAGEHFYHPHADDPLLLLAWVFGPPGVTYRASVSVNGSQVGSIVFDQILPDHQWSSASILLPPLAPGVYRISGRLVGPPSSTGAYSAASNATVDVFVRVGEHEPKEGEASEQAVDVGEGERGREGRLSGSAESGAAARDVEIDDARADAEGATESKGGDARAGARASTPEQVCEARGVGRLERLLGMSEEQVADAVRDLEQLLQQQQHAGGDRDSGRGMGRMEMGGNSVSPLQEVLVRLHAVLHAGGMLPIGLQPSTPHDGISDVWGIERGGAPVRALIDRFLDRVGPALPEESRCLEWGRHYSQGALREVCNCGMGDGGWCSTSWSIEYGGCDEGWYAAKQTVCADITRLSSVMPADDAGFDVIVCTQVLEHVADPSAAVREMYRALAPGGRLVLTVPFMEQYHEAAGQFRDYWRWTHVGARKMLEEAGFQIDRLESAGSTLTTTAAQLGLGIDDIDVGEMLEGSVGDYSAAGDDDWGVHDAQYQGVHVLASRPLRSA